MLYVNKKKDEKSKSQYVWDKCLIAARNSQKNYPRVQQCLAFLPFSFCMSETKKIHLLLSQTDIIMDPTAGWRCLGKLDSAEISEA